VSYESLKKALLSEAANQADEAAAEIQERLRSEEQRIAAKAKSAEEEIISQANADGVVAASRLHQEHQLAAKANVLNAKQEELDTTQDAVVNEILSWDESATTALLKHLLTLVPEGATITVGENHADALNKIGAKNVEGTTIKNDGGLIASSEFAEVNLTIRHLVAQLFIRHRAVIAAQLF